MTMAMAQAGTVSHAGKGPVAPPIPGCPPMSYTYVEAGWFHTDVDAPGNPTNDAGYIDLLYDVGHNVFLEGTATLGGGDFDLVDLSLGAGYYFPLHEKFHLTARAGGGYLDVDLGEGFNEFGFYLAPGFRFQVTCNLEIYGKAFYSEFQNDDGGNWSIGGGITYLINEKVGLNLGYSDADDGWVVQAGIRYNF
jgi:hypothetical protein